MDPNRRTGFSRVIKVTRAPQLEPSKWDLFEDGDNLQSQLSEARPPHLIPVPPYVPFPNTPPCSNSATSSAGPMVAALIFDPVNNYALSTSFFSSMHHLGDLFALDTNMPLRNRELSEIEHSDPAIRTISQVCRAARNAARPFICRTVSVGQPQHWTGLLQRVQNAPYLHRSVKILNIVHHVKRVGYPDVDPRLCELLPSVRIVRFGGHAFDQGLLSSLPSVRQLILSPMRIQAVSKLSSLLPSPIISEMLIHCSGAYDLNSMVAWAEQIGLVQSLRRVRLNLGQDFITESERFIKTIQKTEGIRELKLVFPIESFLGPMHAVLEQHARTLCFFTPLLLILIIIKCVTWNLPRSRILSLKLITG
jgi:hypothetical protein